VGTPHADVQDEEVQSSSADRRIPDPVQLPGTGDGEVVGLELVALIPHREPGMSPLEKG
jgi:hypothetical protein